jgi:DNA polymerase III delta prime subunit
MIEVENELEQFIWSEAHRPHTIDDCILPDSVKAEFNGLLRKKNLPNLILTGSSGTGKTSVARAMCEQLGCDYIIINGSGGLNLETLRVKVTEFVTSVSMNGKRKCIIADESDGLTVAVQKELRGFIEEHTKNAFWIFTCNSQNKILPPIQSRCSVIDFKLNKSDRPAIAAKFMSRVTQILDSENVTYEKNVIAKIVMQYFPDFRRTLNELQRYSANNVIDAGILSKAVETDVSELIKTIKDKNFKNMRQWCENNSDGDFNVIYQKLFDELLDQVNEVPQVVLIISEASYREYFTANHTINLVACCVEIMGTATFR